MQRDLQNAYSRQASLEVERQIGAARHGQRRLLVPARRRAADGRSTRTCRRACRRAPTTAAGRFPTTPTTAGTRRPARRPTTRCSCRCAQRPSDVGLLPGQLHAVEGRERRRRVLLQRADRPLRPVEGLGPRRQRPAAPVRVLGRRQHADGRRPTTVWQALTHGFQVSTMLQAYSAAPFNITSGVTTRAGHGRPAGRRRRVHPAQLRRGRRVLHHEPAREPRVPRSAARCRSRRSPRCST